MSAPNPLRSYRLRAGLTLQQLGRQIGVHKTTILRWEEGRIPAERMVEIERVTGLPRRKLRPDLFQVA